MKKILISILFLVLTSCGSTPELTDDPTVLNCERETHGYIQRDYLMSELDPGYKPLFEALFQECLMESNKE